MNFILALLLVAIYFSPTICEQIVNKDIRGRVFLINFLLGWTVIAWIYAFVLVLQERKRKRLLHALIIEVRPKK